MSSPNALSSTVIGLQVSPSPENYENVSIPPFDPSIHLAFEPPTARHSFTELGLERPSSAPDMCFTEPFQLFSEEGVRMIRRDLLRKEVLDKHLTAWHRAPCYIGGHEETATWISSMWQHPEVVDCISRAFGNPVKILGRKGEIGHVNVQLGPEGKDGVYKLAETPSPPLQGGQEGSSQYEKVLTDAWHRDSAQLTVVVMLSDTSTMIGGETAIQTGNGKVLKARGAKMGGAVVMQGSHVTHAALRASNAAERLSMVTGFAFADPDLDDSGTSLRSIDKNDVDMKQVYDHFVIHKLLKLRERIDVEIERARRRQESEEVVKNEEFEPWVAEQITFLKQTSWELFKRHPDYSYKDMPGDALRNYLHHVWATKPGECGEHSGG